MRRGVAALVTVVVLAAAPAPAQVWPSIWSQAKRDATSLFTVDRPPSATELGVGLAALGLLAANDEHLATEGQRHLPGWLDQLNHGGEVRAANAVSAALLAGGLIFRERSGVMGGLTLLEGNFVLNFILDASKNAFGRLRPNQPNGGDFLASGDSFPSSHAAHAFMIAAVLDATVDRPAWRWVFYPLASGVALARVQGGVHFPTDVVVGGLLGWWVGHRLSVAHNLGTDTLASHVALVPIKGGAVLTASFAW
jgi:membrane-associated phospholipid phosphatase